MCSLFGLTFLRPCIVLPIVDKPHFDEAGIRYSHLKADTCRAPLAMLLLGFAMPSIRHLSLPEKAWIFPLAEDLAQINSIPDEIPEAYKPQPRGLLDLENSDRE